MANMSPPSLLLLSLPLFHPLSLLSIPPPLLSPLPTPPPSSAPPLLSSQPICHIHHHCRGHYYYSILSLLSSTPPLLFPLPLSLPSQSHRHRYHHNIFKLFLDCAVTYFSVQLVVNLVHELRQRKVTLLHQPHDDIS